MSHLMMPIKSKLLVCFAVDGFFFQLAEAKKDQRGVFVAQRMEYERDAGQLGGRRLTARCLEPRCGWESLMQKRRDR